MKRISFIMVTLLIILSGLSGKQISEYKKKLKNGNTLVKKRYRDESNGLIKIEGIYNKEGELQKQTLYYKKNPKNIETQITTFKDGKAVLDYYEYVKDNPKHLITMIDEYKYEDEVIIKKIKYDKNHPDANSEEIYTVDLSFSPLQTVIIYDSTRSLEHVEKIVYFYNKEKKIVKQENYFSKENINDFKETVNHFIDYENEKIEKKEIYFYPNLENISSLVVYYMENIVIEERIFDKNENYLKKSIV